MKLCYTHSLSSCIMRIFLLFCYLVLFVIPFVFSTVRRHPHFSNASDREALLGFMSAVTNHPSESLPTTWKRNVSFCQWTGIACSRRRQRVVSLNVSSMGLHEYGLSGCVTTKGDVYSYGIVLLEMLTGKKPTNNMFLEGMNLQKWVGSAFPNRVGEVVDTSILRRTSAGTEEDKDLDFLRQLINVGLLCTKESPEGHPNMMHIVGTLQSIKETFLGVVGIQKFQSNITHLLGNSSTTRNNATESQSSSTF